MFHFGLSTWDYFNALLYGMTRKKRQQHATSTELSRQTCVHCAIPLSIPVIFQIPALVSCQRNVSSTNLPLWRNKFNYASSHLTSPTHRPVSTCSLSAFDKFYVSHHSTHPKQSPQLRLSASPPKLSGIICRLQLEKRFQIPNYCADWRDILSNALLVDHGYQAPLNRCRYLQWIPWHCIQVQQLIDDWIEF